MIEYRDTFEVGSGTVLKGIQAIEEYGAIRLKRRGHQGTTILSHDISRLWYLAQLPNVRITVPPPGPLDLSGLFQGIRSEFSRLGLTVQFSSRAGSEQRLNSVAHAESEFAVLSEGAIACWLDRQSQAMSILPLGPNSFYTKDSVSVMCRRGDEKKGKTRVGIDRRSSDHVRLTEAEFAPDGGWTYVEIDYNDGPAALLRDEIDHSIWHACHMLVPLDLIELKRRPLGHRAAELLTAELSQAVLCARSDQLHLLALAAQLHPAAIRATQQNFLKLNPASAEFRENVWF